MHAERHQVMATGLLLATFALLGTALLSGTQWHSAPYIAANERQALLDSLSVVIPPSEFDNDILDDSIEISDPELLGMHAPTRVYRARLQDRDTAVAFRVVAPDGYSGAIVLLMGVRADGEISGVRVISQRETPGLGDAIEARRSNWILGFAGRSLGNPGEAGWHVQRDGGDFEQFTGATISPRAVVKAVHNGLKFFTRHRAQLFAPGSTTVSATAPASTGIEQGGTPS